MHKYTLLCLFLVATLGTPIELIANGNFESNSLSGWTYTKAPGSNGDLSIVANVDGTTAFSGTSYPKNPNGGNYVAMSDQGGPGSYALTQSFTVDQSLVSLDLSFDIYVKNTASVYYLDNNMDQNGAPNQYCRADLIKGSASDTSTSPNDIITNFSFGCAGTQPWTTYSFDVLPYVQVGQTYKLRFSEVDNQGFLNLGVDNVSLRKTIPVCGNGVVEAGETCDYAGMDQCCVNCRTQPSNTLCRGSAGICDVQETCGGASVCPADQVQPKSFTCRAAADGCDFAEKCDGSSKFCPPDVKNQNATCFCARQNIAPGAQGYYCNAAGGFYQCMSGAWASQSRDMACSKGTTCACNFGEECSCNGKRSPCVYPSQVGAACPK